MKMSGRTVGLVAVGVLVASLALAGVTAVGAGGPWGQGGPGYAACGPGGHGPGGMMGGGTMGGGMMGAAMMGGGMMSGGGQGGYGSGGMMGGWTPATTTETPITLEQARQKVQACLDQIGNPDLAIDEVMEFQNDFYALITEKSTGTGAFEFLVDRVTGGVHPEHGPTMMWNTRYGMMASMGGAGHMPGYQPPSGPMTVTADQARQYAQSWLDQNQPGSTTEQPHQFSGYYTAHTVKDGQVTGMLSVNGYTGQVWYHVWHGPFVGAVEGGQ